jgi:oxygen-independent coproporphyrinogen III oxidase
VLGLYIHVPFCAAICNYCNFNRGLFDSQLKARYVEALLSEIRTSQSETSPRADTIYFGGGTPSLLDPVDVARIIHVCETAFDVVVDREVTMEANPETVTPERLASYRAAGVNRISFGVQSFRDDELARLSRLHNAARGRQAVHEARGAGFDNISVDLMMWLPGQRLDQWLESVEAAVELAPEHLSLYLLELYPNAPLREEMARREWSQAPEEDAAAMYLGTMGRLESAGYEQYEISNVSVAGRHSRHNMKYWTDGEWIGFGCGAHSTRAGVRWKNVSDIAEYVGRIDRGEPTAVDRHQLTNEQQLGDALFMGLRLAEGIDLAPIGSRYGMNVWERYGPELEIFVERGWLRLEGSRLWLTREAMLVANEVMRIFV